MNKVMRQSGDRRSIRSTISRNLALGLSSMLVIAGLAIASASSASAAGLTPATLSNASIGAAYSAALTSPTAGIWTISAGTLPAGLALASTTVTAANSIAGTPTADGTYNFTVTVIDSTTPATYTQAYTLTVTGIAPGTLASPILINTAYSETLTVATAGAWSVSAGTLPAGLTLTAAADSATDTITGTPTADGSSSFTVTVTDSTTPATYTQAYTLVVANQIPSPALTVEASQGQVGNSITLFFAGGQPGVTPTYAVTNGTATGCLIAGVTVTASAPGTCLVTGSEAETSSYDAATSAVATITFLPASTIPPVSILSATRVIGSPDAGKTVTVTIVGTDFYGKPTIKSSDKGTKAVVVGDSGTRLKVKVTAAKTTHKGVATFTITVSDGTSVRVKYISK